MCAARPGEELRVERCVKDPRSLSLPIMRSASTHISSTDRAEHGSLGRREAADLLVGLVGHSLCIGETGVSCHKRNFMIFFFFFKILLKSRGDSLPHLIKCIMFPGL